MQVLPRGRRTLHLVGDHRRGVRREEERLLPQDDDHGQGQHRSEACSQASLHHVQQRQEGRQGAEDLHLHRSETRGPPGCGHIHGVRRRRDEDRIGDGEEVHRLPLKVGKCDNGLLGPAETDYVIEARITFETAKEGPFVDITGTYDFIRDQPVIKAEKIWACKDPVMQLLLPGGNEHYLFMGLPREPIIFKTVQQAVPRTHNVRLTEGGCCWLNGVVSITKNKEGDGMNAIMAAFTGHPSMKHVIIVDEDIDIFDDRQVEWAVATRFQADRMLRIPGAAGSSLDPSAEGTTWKMG
ncbi:MAG: UbiD family decarboxylase, partial [Candidatus Methanomethylophilaceae archaeon]|nr:UbiD family decarboxylase [Candidatus Methanomethylophilaceae archaeon]